jgi:hypothetical protein
MGIGELRADRCRRVYGGSVPATKAQLRRCGLQRAPSVGGLEGLEELDVVGFDLKTDRKYICEVTTHPCGLLYMKNCVTADRIKKKHERRKL